MFSYKTYGLHYLPKNLKFLNKPTYPEKDFLEPSGEADLFFLAVFPV